MSGFMVAAVAQRGPGGSGLAALAAFGKKMSGNVQTVQPRRHLNLLEYQAKGLLQKYQVTVQDFRVAASEGEARAIPEHFRCKEYVIKAQVLAGGRGKGHFDNGFKVSATAGQMPVAFV